MAYQYLKKLILLTKIPAHLLEESREHGTFVVGQLGSVAELSHSPLVHDDHLVAGQYRVDPVRNSHHRDPIFLHLRVQRRLDSLICAH